VPIGGAKPAVGRWVNWFHLGGSTSHITTQATVYWPADGALRLRASGSQWLVFDDRGRLLHLDTASSEVLRLAVR
jgi:hypothetical protein